MNTDPASLDVAGRVLTDGVAALRAASGRRADGNTRIAALLQCAALTRQVEQVMVAVVAGLDRDGFFAERGYARSAQAVADLLRWDTPRAAHLLRAAEQVAERSTVDGRLPPPRLPATAAGFAAAGFAAGRISLRHVEVIADALKTAAAGRLTPSGWAGAEEQLAQHAGSYRPRELARFAHELVSVLDQDGSAPDEREVEQLNELHLTRTGDGGGRIAGQFNAPTFAAMLTIVDALARPSPEDRRSRPERHTDALGELCRNALDEDALPTCGGERPHLSVTLPLAELEHRARNATLDHGGSMTPTDLRMLACDARVIPIVLGGAGQPLDIGRARSTVPTHLRRAVAARDRGCAFPGCSATPSWCDVHHLRTMFSNGNTAEAPTYPTSQCSADSTIDWSITRIGPFEYTTDSPSSRRQPGSTHNGHRAGNHRHQYLPQLLRANNRSLLDRDVRAWRTRPRVARRVHDLGRGRVPVRRSGRRCMVGFEQLAVEEFEAAVGADAVISDPARCRAYECDGLTGYRVTPKLVLLPRSAAAVAAAVTVCARHGIPFVARGAGTGLSGGALPVADGVVISLARLKRVLEVDPVDRRAVLEPGVTNLEITKAAAPYGLYYAPDPSSQQVCTIGGNVAENSGGAHCLKYGFTTNHVLALEVVLADGSVVTLGGDTGEQLGPDLRGVFLGSEGTVGIATKITVRLLRVPETVRTLLADFPSIRAAGEVVSDIIAAGIVPAAVEMMDTLAIEAAEAAVHAGYTIGAPAALVVELDGPAEECRVQFEQVTAICEKHACTRLHIAGDAEERAAIWRGRKSAFAAVGRISPDYFVQDGVVPRTRLAEALERIAAMGEDAGLRVANVFHAGDGNLHPLVLFDADMGQTGRAEKLSAQIAELCVELGGSLSGEHGIGTDKACSMGKMFSEDDLAVMGRVRGAFDPQGLCNPGKVLPTPRLCGERPGKYRPHPLEEAGVIERL